MYLAKIDDNGVSIIVSPFQSERVVVKMGGKGKAFIGANVIFDGIHPELITIGNGAVITRGVCILSHFYSPKESLFYLGKVNI